MSKGSVGKKEEKYDIYPRLIEVWVLEKKELENIQKITMESDRKEFKQEFITIVPPKLRKFEVKFGQKYVLWSAGRRGYTRCC